MFWDQVMPWIWQAQVQASRAPWKRRHCSSLTSPLVQLSLKWNSSCFSWASDWPFSAACSRPMNLLVAATCSEQPYQHISSLTCTLQHHPEEIWSVNAGWDDGAQTVFSVSDSAQTHRCRHRLSRPHGGPWQSHMESCRDAFISSAWTRSSWALHLNQLACRCHRSWWHACENRWQEPICPE